MFRLQAGQYDDDLLLQQQPKSKPTASKLAMNKRANKSQVAKLAAKFAKKAAASGVRKKTVASSAFAKTLLKDLDRNAAKPKMLKRVENSFRIRHLLYQRFFCSGTSTDNE